MADKSAIAWLAGPDGAPGATWQVLAGCSKASKGCDNCYSCRQGMLRSLSSRRSSPFPHP